MPYNPNCLRDTIAASQYHSYAGYNRDAAVNTAATPAVVKEPTNPAYQRAKANTPWPVNSARLPIYYREVI